MPNLNRLLDYLNDLFFRVLTAADLDNYLTYGFIPPSDPHANITPKEHVKGRIRPPRLPSQFTSWSANYKTTRHHASVSGTGHEFLVAGDIAGDRIVALYGPDELDLFVRDAAQRFQTNCGHLSDQEYKGKRLPIFLRSECAQCQQNDDFDEEDWIPVLSDMELFDLIPEREENWLDCLSEDDMDLIPEHLLRRVSTA
ncbi:hypothetical protein HDU80_001823 [Chytriomyces hyalinus]|nr:hypothetical protein HDU80_001823 [Chytriomyces hyalinus]